MDLGQSCPNDFVLGDHAAAAAAAAAGTAAVAALLRNMRGEEVWVESRHTTAIVLLVVRTTITAGAGFLYPATTIVQGVSVLLSGKRDRRVHVRGGNRALRYVVPRPMTSKTHPLCPLGAGFRCGLQPDGFITGGGGIGGIAPSGGSVGTQPIAGTCPPVPNGFGPELSQRFCLG